MTLEISDQPEVLETHWDHPQVLAFFRDLEAGADIKHVQVRLSGGGSASDHGTTLAKARELFEQGNVRAIQIRYLFEQQAWCDTLMMLPEAVRVVRTRAPTPSCH